MRVLFVSYPEKSFLQAMTPLAWALRTAGHDVCFASQPELIEDITRTGLTAVSVGRDRGTWRLAELDPARRERERHGLLDPYNAAVLPPDELCWERMRAGYQRYVTYWHQTDNFPMMADLVAFARHWQPDLVIWEPTTYAAPIAAQACGAAHARMLWSLDIFAVTHHHYRRLTNQQPPHQRTDPLTDWLTPYATKYGSTHTDTLLTGHFTIDQLPPPLTLQAPDHHYLPMQYIPYGGPATIPTWLRTPPQRPRVALTLGITATNRFNGYIADTQDILNALADLDIELIATIAESEQHHLTHIPTNTRVVPYVPLHALAPTCTAAIHHAGPGTLNTINRYGIPQLTLPWDFDEPALAQRLTNHGAGITLDPSQATGTDIRNALQQLLTNPTYTRHAHTLRDETRHQPTPNQLVTTLEKLTTQHRTR